jgi:hypothetical protein
MNEISQIEKMEAKIKERILEKNPYEVRTLDKGIEYYIYIIDALERDLTSYFRAQGKQGNRFSLLESSNDSELVCRCVSAFILYPTW